MSLSSVWAALAGVRGAARAARVPELPPTVFRCARCGERVGRYRPGPGKSFRVPTDFTCKAHGPLQDPGAIWGAEWTRQGRPDRLNLRLPPSVQ